jgi:signal transduction histidine kinase/CheY-like chemotaxis protein
VTRADNEIARLGAENAKLRKINAALMSRVERAMDQPNNAFGLFEVAITLDKTVRQRTAELQAALRSVEGVNEALTRAKVLAEQAQAQAEQANAFKSSFLAFVSHDLLQPLNAARLNLSTLTEAAPGEEALRLTRQIDLALTSLEDLIRTLLDMSKLDAGAMRPEVASVELERILSGLRDEFTALAASRGLKLTIRPSRAFVRTDQLLLRRILQNLVNNALRYTRRGGVLVGARARGDHIRIEVSDTGPGIAPERREAIFEEFAREGGSGEGGFGLGLSIVRRLAQALDIPVDLASRVGFGSTFAVELPAAPASPAVAVVGLPESIRGVRGAQILVIENEHAVAAAMRALLERWGCRVHVAASPGEAREAVRGGASSPDLLIADYHLDEGARGFDAIDAVQGEVGAPVPACIVTADLSETVIAAAGARGLEILHKPIKPAELRSLMAYLLA